MLNKFCFSVDQRVHDPHTYRWVMQPKKRIFNKHFVVYHRVHPIDYSRVGVIVSKRTAKHAVVRNRIKRVVREWFRLNHHSIKAQSLVIIAKKSAASVQNQELTTCLHELEKKLIN